MGRLTPGQDANPVNAAGHETRADDPVFASRGRTRFFWLVVAYFFIEYGRPQDYVPILGAIRPGLIMSLLVFGAWIMAGDRAILRHPAVRLTILFILVNAATVVFAVNTFWVYQNSLTLFITVAGGMLPVAAFLASRAALTRFLNIWIGIHVFTALMSIRSGGVGPGSFLRDENDLALAFIMVIPYAFYLYLSPLSSARAKVLYALALITLLTAVVFTASRGGFVGLVAVLGGIWLFSRHRTRSLMLTLMLAGIFYVAAPDSYIQEIKSITDPSSATRVDRLYSWGQGWDMFVDNPILGVGSGNFPWRVHEYEVQSKTYDPFTMRSIGGRVAHSIYFTLLPELGLTGTLVYLSLLVTIFLRLRRIMALGNPDHDPPAEVQEQALLARAVLVALLGYLVTGVFLSVLYYPHLWYHLGFALALERSAHPRHRTGRG